MLKKYKMERSTHGGYQGRLLGGSGSQRLEQIWSFGTTRAWTLLSCDRKNPADTWDHASAPGESGRNSVPVEGLPMVIMLSPGKEKRA